MIRTMTRAYLVWGLLLGPIIPIVSTEPTDHVLTSDSRNEGPKSARKSVGHSSKIDTRNNSPELNNFLEDVLSAQEELKWIDRAVHRSANVKDFSEYYDNRKMGDKKLRSNDNDGRRESIDSNGEIMTKREIENNRSSSGTSLAALKRTILELSDSLNPRDCEDDGRRDDEDGTELGRKLLWSENVKLGIAIEYYDYEDNGDSVADSVPENSIDRGGNHENSQRPEVYYPVKTQIQPKKDENSEEERKEEEERRKLKNKYPKEEFISDTVERQPEMTSIGKNGEDDASTLDNFPPNPMILKRIPADADSDDSDFYSQCKLESSPNDSDDARPEKNSIVNGRYLVVDSDRPEVVGDAEKPESSVERGYLVITPEVKKNRSRKRSVDFAESSPIVGTKIPTISSSAEKSAKNYIALKTTDDMFKGGVEQSNPLGEDKPIESPSFSSFSSSSSSGSSSSAGNSLFSRRSRETESDVPERKVIEPLVDTEKIPQPEYSAQPKRLFRRRLNQIIDDRSSDRANFSSDSAASTTNNLSHITTLTRELSTSDNKSSRAISVSTRPPSFREITDRNIFSTTVQSSNATTVRACGTTLSLPNSNLTNENRNSTRMRRNVGFFGRENSPNIRREVHREERGKGRKRMSVDGVENESPSRKLTVLLAADNVDDESQIDLAVHGELAGKIVEKIFQEVQRNEGLKVALGPGLYRKHKPQESIALDKMYRQGLDEEEVKETEAMMRRVMELLGRLVLDEVRRKTCASLAPDMHDFLQWSLGLEEIAEPLSDQVPPLPMIPVNRHDPTERPPPSAEKFLFQNSPNGESSASGDLSELERKVALLRSLINEYKALTEREKTKVQTVHDYLVRQLALLMKYIESKEAANRKGISVRPDTAGARLPPGKQNILQYQASMPNRESKKSREIGFNTTEREPIKNGDSQPTWDATSSIFRRFDEDSREKGRLWTVRKKRKHRSPESFESRRETIEDGSNFVPQQSLEYRKLLRRIATLRRKRHADSFGYELPKIFARPTELRSTVPEISFADVEKSATTIFVSGSSSVGFPIPVTGKNLAEDEVLLLNKREAWKRENQRLLEEVAFGKDTRNDFIDRDDDARIKRAFDYNVSSILTTTINDNSKINEKPNFDARTRNLRSMEKKINVFPIKN